MGTAGESKQPCDQLIINKDRRSILVKLIADFDSQLGQVSSDSPLQQSLMGNLNAAKAAIDVIDKA